MNDQPELVQGLPNSVCEDCGAGLSETMQAETIALGEHGEHFVVEVPVMRCSGCKFAFTDSRAERLRHAGACKHMGVLTPAEVKSVREALSMTRKEFDSAYGIPPASMERWENGRLIQNKSTDTLLRALSNRAIAYRLDRRRERAVPSDSVVVYGRFPTLEHENRLTDAEGRARNFQLRATAKCSV